jgi:hypothetical protein
MFVGIANTLAKLCPFRKKPSIEGKEAGYIHHIEHGYPSNHTYCLTNDKLKPKYKLASRYKKIRQLLPKQLTSLAEVGCSKGFFVFSAGAYPSCTRALGIDVSPFDIEVCRWVKQQLNSTNTRFEKMQLHELTPSITDLGGPFQTLLIINTYQYLYFGSDSFPECYLNHDAIFNSLRKICSQRIIFNNRIALEDCQNVARINKASEECRENYSEEKALAAAAKYFTISKHGKIGKYPLFTLDVK